VAVGAWVGKGPVHQMKNICAGETAPGRVIMRAVTFALIGVGFHGPQGTGLNTQHSFKGHYCP
jgi:hypothetical protein